MADVQDLGAALAEAIALAQGSAAEGWGQRRTTQAIVDSLTAHLRRLHRGDRSQLDDLRLAFAPTGELQELSMANDWSERYLSLAARVDRALDGLL